MLKLVAMDDEDLQIVAAHMQDAVLKVADLDYRPSEKRVILVCNRFVWENQAVGKLKRRSNTQFERRRTVLHFDGVTAVRAQGIARDRPDDILSLMTMHFEQTDAPSGVVELVFAAGKTLRLDVDYIELRLSDLGPAWETGSKPDHAVNKE